MRLHTRTQNDAAAMMDVHDATLHNCETHHGIECVLTRAIGMSIVFHCVNRVRTIAIIAIAH